MASSNFPAVLKITNDKGEMTQDFRRWLDDVFVQRAPMVMQPLKESGVNFTGDLAGKTVTIVNGVITGVV